MFSEALAASRSLLEPGTAVLIDVEAEPDGESVKVRVQRIVSLDRAAEARHDGMKIYVEDIRALKPLAEQVGPGGGQGQFRLVLRLDDLSSEVEFVLPQGIELDPEAEERAQIRGRGCRDQRPLRGFGAQLARARGLAKHRGAAYKPLISHAGCVARACSAFALAPVT